MIYDNYDRRGVQKGMGIQKRGIERQKRNNEKGGRENKKMKKKGQGKE